MTLNNEGFLLLRCLIYFRLSPKSCNRTTRRWASTVVLPPQAVSLLLLQFCAQSSTKHELGGCFQPICKNISQIGSLSPARGEHQKKKHHHLQNQKPNHSNFEEMCFSDPKKKTTLDKSHGNPHGNPTVPGSNNTWNLHKLIHGFPTLQFFTFFVVWYCWWFRNPKANHLFDV